MSFVTLSRCVCILSIISVAKVMRCIIVFCLYSFKKCIITVRAQDDNFIFYFYFIFLLFTISLISLSSISMMDKIMWLRRWEEDENSDSAKTLQTGIQECYNYRLRTLRTFTELYLLLLTTGVFLHFKRHVFKICLKDGSLCLKKCPTFIFCDIFSKCWPILISLIHSWMNGRWSWIKLCRLTSKLLPPYLAKSECASVKLFL